MSGIYLHIPFCKTRCVYCDFFSSTDSKWQGRYVQALCRELCERKEYLKGEPVETLYFGGGTPSQLSEEEFRQLFDTMEEVYGLTPLTEITLEANPDDLTEEYVSMLRTLPFNRISMGIQTFDDRLLRLLNRRHTAAEAVSAVERCRRLGFENISIDLMYGLPGETEASWAEDLRQAIALAPEHISAYHLIYEENTPLYRLWQQHRVEQADEELSLRLFSQLIDTLAAAGYEQYEISNFCHPPHYSRHNSSYWQGTPYLGCGASAHSFDGGSRRWNVASLQSYVTAVEQGKPMFEMEELDLTTRYNEAIITGLRTRWGVEIEGLRQRFGSTLSDYCLLQAAPYIESGKLTVTDGVLRLTRVGIFVSDGIMSDLLWVEKE
jgi:oxygen-independent coproporphyrinogen-3 oxidase